MKKITPRILRISKFELDFWIFWAKKGFLPFSFSSSKIFIGFEEFWIFPWKIRGIWIFHRWTFCSQSEKKRYDLRNFGFFGEFYFDHGKFYVSESRNFGFFCFNILLSAKKIVKGFKEFWIFPQSFYPSRENLLFENQGNLEIFLTTVFSYPRNYQLDLRNFGIFYANFHHWKFSTSKSRNFGFFSVSIFSLIQENIHRIWRI